MSQRRRSEGPPDVGLGRRERQIMDVLHRGRRLSVAEVQRQLPDPPSYSAVRTMLGVLERKGHVVHEEQGRTFYYRPSLPRNAVRRGALAHIINTFFDGSETEMVAALLESRRRRMSQTDLDRLAMLIEEARKEGR
jgi:predicted transcriptional regulator